jgi:hypothetical protein
LEKKAAHRELLAEHSRFRALFLEARGNARNRAAVPRAAGTFLQREISQRRGAALHVSTEAAWLGRGTCKLFRSFLSDSFVREEAEKN